MVYFVVYNICDLFISIFTVHKNNVFNYIFTQIFMGIYCVKKPFIFNLLFIILHLCFENHIKIFFERDFEWPLLVQNFGLYFMV